MNVCDCILDGHMKKKSRLRRMSMSSSLLRRSTRISVITQPHWAVLTEPFLAGDGIRKLLLIGSLKASPTSNQVGSIFSGELFLSQSRFTLTPLSV